jgi:serine/threonine protein kinase
MLKASRRCARVQGRAPGLAPLTGRARARPSPALSSQGSRYVARLEGLYEDAEHAYLVQELCGQGLTLKALLGARGGCLPEAEAAAVMRGVLDVLCECHRRDLVYGDVKVRRGTARRGCQEGWGGGRTPRRRLWAAAGV